jgi:acyl transferase domain-containing protein/NAD(P)H-dependent flavin oxidoreductase YrpB (nitropropane dioxygenase family)
MNNDTRAFEILVIPPGGPDNAGLALAAARAGALGIVDLDACGKRGAVERVLRAGQGLPAGSLGIRLAESEEAFWGPLLDDLPEACGTALVTFESAAGLARNVKRLRGKGLRVLLEVTGPDAVAAGEKHAVDGFVAKGNEAAGWNSPLTTFLLLQQTVGATPRPVYAQGGVGMRTAAACWAAGAAGVVLDWQLALVRESVLPEALAQRVAHLDGRETRSFGERLGLSFRAYVPTQSGLRDMLEQTVREAAARERPVERSAAWREAVRAGMRRRDAQRLLPMSQDVAFAGRFAERFRTVTGVIAALRRAVAAHVAAAKRVSPLAEGEGSAAVLGSRYPVIQGPMSRVSDTAEFAAAVADAGGLPIMAGAMMDPERELKPMLDETARAVGARPWGVGLLGFMKPDLYAAQVAMVKQAAPPVVLIAGGTAQQAKEFESDGIHAYIHVQSTALLKASIEEGCRRFVFEGRECGGHIGPYPSAVLWENAVETLLEIVTEQDGAEFDVWFAGGIHDALSAAMLSAVAAPLVERGVHIGALMGTAYLMTEEAVSCGAVTRAYQARLLKAAGTDVLDSGGGYEVRTAPCPFTAVFENEKARLLAEGRPALEVRDALELLNLGRLRMAAKGEAFNLKSLEDPAAPVTHTLSAARQREDGLFMAGQVLALHADAVSIRALHEAVCAEGSRLARALPAPRDGTARVSVSDPRDSDVAIIGMHCVFPQAADVRAYWENILRKVYAIREIPPERWDWKEYFDATPGARDKIYSRWGGFIDPIPFDPISFKIPPNALKAIDPLQLFPLVVTRGALEDAGYLGRPFDHERTGCVFGVAGGMGDLGLMYGFRALLPLFFESIPEALLEQLPEWTEDSFPGILANVVAGRVANSFDLRGANYTVDAACGSGLTAVYAGVREIATGASDMMVVGASDVMQNPFGFLCFAQTRALSPTGRPRPFDAKGDGISIGEGIGALVLKRLDQAERDGDRIYAVIRGVGAGGDGQGASMTAPQTQGQLRAIRHAYRGAGFGVGTVELMEAHGTGTTLGDGVEARTLRDAYLQEHALPGTCAVGTVKSMIGHTKGCAGIAGLIKCALALYHKVLPPTLGVETPSPAECWASDSPVYLNTESRPWIAGAGPRRAGVDAFGFGGSNFHAVLEEHGGAWEPPEFPMDHLPGELFVWAAETPDALLTAVRSFRERLQGLDPAPALKDLAAVVTRAGLEDRTGRARLALVAESVDDLTAKLDAADASLASGKTELDDPRGVYVSTAARGLDGKVAFLFPGQASQRPDMLRDLAVFFAEARAALAAADGVVADRLPKHLSRYIYPPPRFNAEDEARCLTELTATDVAQPALGAVSMAMLRVLETLGLEPDMTAGHSTGEYTALCAAGMIGEETLYDLLTERGRAMAAACTGDTGSMLAVKAGPDALHAALQGVDDVYVANLNAPRQTILSGREEALAQVAERLERDGIRSRPIAVSCGFHSPFVAPARAAFDGVLAPTRFRKPRLPVYANVTAGVYPRSEAAIRKLLGDHLVHSVRFAEEIQAMADAGASVFVEVGPGSVLTGLVSQILEDRDVVTVSTDAKSPRHGIVTLLQALARLAAEGVALDAAPLFERRAIAALDAQTLRPKRPRTEKRASWLLAPDRAWPASEPRPTRRKVSGPAAGPAGPVPAMPVAAGTPAAGGTADVVARYQKLMADFMEQQRQVMLAFLGQAPASTAALAPMPPPAAPPPPAPEMQAVAPVVQVHTAEATTADEAGRTGEADNLQSRLLNIVADRTGYPPDMLDLDLDLESDLGIDSIKRVEILTTFGKSLANAPDGLAEKLRGARTLRNVIAIAGNGHD